MHNTHKYKKLINFLFSLIKHNSWSGGLKFATLKVDRYT